MKAHTHKKKKKISFKRVGKHKIRKLIQSAARIDRDTGLHHVTFLSVTVADCLR